MEENNPDTHSDPFLRHYSNRKRLLYGLAFIGLGIVIAGFWNYHLVDGFGKNIVAGNTIGDTEALAGTFGEKGSGFGFIFAAIAGLAATFTACNCVAFAMIPGLACSADQKNTRQSAIKAVTAFVIPVALVGAVYGIFIGFLGPEGIELFNQRSIRIAQAQSVFSIIGIIMIIWGFIELGYLKRITNRFSSQTREFFGNPTTKASMLGVLVGLFAVGRPFPVFRQFLTYAATANSPLYGSLVMIIHGIGQVTVMLLLFLILVYFFGNRMMKWVNETPHKPRMLTSLALLAGGAYFIFYWGIAFIYDVGRWGFKLGWYG
ncbi:MAG: sulfite exporter TauE/SafE family protein [Balneolaceae bacterium]|nr:sulfite exporter TauE/SafE family protein [Balneolaceae bacterium]